MLQEGQAGIEMEPKEEERPHIRLEFFRHDEKGSAKSLAGDAIPDQEVRLSATGRAHATELGKTKNPVPETAVAFGSRRKRALETSYRHMLADQDIPENASLEDIEALISKNLKGPKKGKMIEQLDFDWDTNPEFSKTARDRYTNSQDALMFMWRESDEMVKRNRDQTSDSYSRSAGKTAELVQKYMTILPKWERVAQKNPEKFAKLGNEMQRFMGSHQTQTETFLMKVIEKLEGEKGVEDFLSSLKTKNGFEMSEGYTVNIRDENGQLAAEIKFRDKSWIVGQELIAKIIAEKQELDKVVNN